MYYRLIAFLLLNFAALALGGIFTGKGVPSEWYQNLEKAPWTPPGWVFGAAWTTIMILFSVYMMYAWEQVSSKKLLIALFAIQWLLNVGWNPLFFSLHQLLPSLVVIVSLTVLVGYFLFAYYSELNLKVLLIAPYFIWLLIASSLNAYAYFKN